MRKSEIDYPRWKRELHVLGVSHEGGETLEEVHIRLSTFLEKTLEKHRNHTVLYVGHGGMGRILTALILHTPLEELQRMPRIENASISIFEINGRETQAVHTERRAAFGLQKWTTLKSSS